MSIAHANLILELGKILALTFIRMEKSKFALRLRSRFRCQDP